MVIDDAPPATMAFGPLTSASAALDGQREPHVAETERAVTQDGREVLVLAPTGRDADLIRDALSAAGVKVTVVTDAPELIDRVSQEVTRDAPPGLGALVSTDDALAIEWSLRLAEVLDRQPPWSDLPLVLLAGSRSAASTEPRWVGSHPAGIVADRLTVRGSVTVLDRPVRIAALVSAVRAALRARARQAEVRELIESRARALEEAEHASAAKSEFLAMMSHELRTPLNAIAGYAELMAIGLRGPVTREQREDLERIMHNQRHLLAIINDILNYARVERGRVEYDIEAVSLSQVISEVTPMIEPQLTAKGLALETQLPAADAIVSVDREKLRQVLINLLSNAIKFTPRGGRVAVDAEASSRDIARPRMVSVHVRDTGIGIPADKLEAIFEPFVQVRSDPSAAREGTGLGLAISRDLVRGMGGDLTAQSDVGRGSCFTLTVPLAD